MTGKLKKVIRMAKRMCIKEMYEEGESKNEISRRLGLNYRTVKQGPCQPDCVNISKTKS